MDLLKPLTAFFEKTKSDQRIGITHIGIYAALLQYRLDRGYSNPVDAVSVEIMRIAKISAHKTYYRCLREMNEYGYLRYLPSKKKNRASKIYFTD
ncbi:hypothetical protein ACLI09_01900 [Flavobacterium sp. RHBU_24]|uniref:hypothetical protein n=1 Tax=Flavobacterium sp. RHBU_24 TaxID=3391185 RepID=UPI00398473EC